MKFNYYYGAQADQFSFIRIPKIMLIDSTFQPLSIAAKVLYGVLLDRMTLSMKNSWLDEEQRVYIIYQIGEIQEDLGFTKKKAMDLLTELETFGLLEKKRRGHGLPNILYVKNFMTEAETRSADMGTSEQEPKSETVSREISETDGLPVQDTESIGMNASEGTELVVIDSSRSAEMGTSGKNPCSSRGAEIGTSRSAGIGTQEVPKTAPQEVPKSAPLRNQTNMNNTYRSNTESHRILSTESIREEDTIREDEMRSAGDPGFRTKAYEEIIRENISFDDLLIAHPDDRDLIVGIKDLILETVVGAQSEILIASGRYPAQVVKSKFLKLNYFHIEYVLSCLKQNTTKVKNIRKYLLAALFNAPSTMDGYYQAEVNHDMPQYALAR